MNKVKKDIRWKQRFKNFENVLSYLEEALAIKKPDIIQKAGLIQFFEMSYELAWNVLKDYLEEEGFNDVKTPRSVIKKSFEIGLISNGKQWLRILEDRNLTSHVYDSKKVTIIENIIRSEYYPLLKDLYLNLNGEMKQ